MYLLFKLSIEDSLTTGAWVLKMTETLVYNYNSTEMALKEKTECYY